MEGSIFDLQGVSIPVNDENILKVDKKTTKTILKLYN